MADADVEKEVRLVVEGIVDALNAADATALAALLADRPGCMHIGSDPNEWWTKQELVDGIRQAMGSGGQVRAENTETIVHSLGDVAWTEGRGRFINTDGSEREVRITGVYVREGGEWRAAQSHASLGVPNDEMFSS